MQINTKVRITPGRKVHGTNPETGRGKQARGAGVVVVEGAEIGHHGPVDIIRWANGVESYHPRHQDTSNVRAA